MATTDKVEIKVGDRVRYQHPRRFWTHWIYGTVLRIVPTYYSLRAYIRTDKGSYTYRYAAELERIAEDANP